MEHVSNRLLHQRLRNRVIELLDLHSCPDAVSRFGAHEAINLVDDFLPLDFHDAPGIFSEAEQLAITSFLILVDRASDVTDTDHLTTDWFTDSPEWGALSNFSRRTYNLFMVRGVSNEEREDTSPT